MSPQEPPGLPGPDEPPDLSPERAPEDAMRPTPVVVLLGWAVAGLVLGRLLRPAAERLSGVAPVVSWVQPLGLLVAAGVLLLAARDTRRLVRERRADLTTQRAVNRLLLARAAALAGALVGGGYAGYAVAWIGSPATLAGQRIERSVAAAVASALLVAAALLLERACRIPAQRPEP